MDILPTQKDAAQNLGRFKVSGTTTRTVTTAYDARGKPSTVTDVAGGSTVTEARSYDGGSQLTDLTIGGGDSPGSYQFIWDTTQAVPKIFETRKNGTTWIRSDYANTIISFKSGFYPKWYKLDARNSIINPDNNTGNANGPTSYDPYGQPTGNKYLDTGYRSETHIGNLIHLRNRDYDPTIGQFTSQDPLDGVDGASSVANPYVYAYNDGHQVADPLGLRGRDCDIGVTCKYVANDLLHSGWRQADSPYDGNDPWYPSWCYRAENYRAEAWASGVKVGFDPLMIYGVLKTEAGGCDPLEPSNTFTDDVGDNLGRTGSYGPMNMSPAHFDAALKSNPWLKQAFLRSGCCSPVDLMRNVSWGVTVGAARLRDIDRLLSRTVRSSPLRNQLREISATEISSLWSESHGSQFYFRSSLVGAAWYSKGTNESVRSKFLDILSQSPTELRTYYAESSLNRSRNARCYWNKYSMNYEKARAEIMPNLGTFKC